MSSKEEPVKIRKDKAMVNMMAVFEFLWRCPDMFFSTILMSFLSPPISTNSLARALSMIPYSSVAKKASPRIMSSSKKFMVNKNRAKLLNRNAIGAM